MESEGKYYRAILKDLDRMKLQILSDLHIEFAPYKFQRTDADIVILAGDIHLGQGGFKWVLENITDQKVIYVLGNHEFYSEATPRLINKLQQQAKGTNINVLENEAVSIKGVRFLGCTLWTDFQLLGDFDYAIGKTRVVCNPFGYMDEQNDRFNPKLTLEI